MNEIGKRQRTNLMCEILNSLLDLPSDLAEAGGEVTHKLNQVLHGLYHFSY
jgi:hypothetical protein